MTSALLGQVQVARFAAAEHQHPHVELASRLQIARVGDDLRYRPEPRRGGQVDVWRHQNRNGAQPRQRGDRDERAGAGLHQHADVRTLSHADLDQAADDVVDAAVHRFVGVDAAVEQQALALGYVAGLLGHDAAKRDPGVVVDLAESREPGQGAIRLDGERPRGLVGGHDCVGGGSRQAERQLRCSGGGVRHP